MSFNVVGNCSEFSLFFISNSLTVSLIADTDATRNTTNTLSPEEITPRPLKAHQCESRRTDWKLSYHYINYCIEVNNSNDYAGKIQLSELKKKKVS